MGPLVRRGRSTWIVRKDDPRNAAPRLPLRLTNPSYQVETFQQAMPDNLGEWLAAIASILTTIAAIFARPERNAKGQR